MAKQKSMTARCVMVLGTSSGAGKSWLAAALCRWWANAGLRVRPFKAQNMSNNARVAPAPGGGWGEMGAAQYFQALAARCAPDVRMNPVLLKPEADTRSQVVLMGQVNAALTALPWAQRGAHCWPHIQRALDELRAECDVLVIEGAGSPAEINLMPRDVVNLRVARHAQARCLLVADIDRGGAFAHLYGTWALLPPADRALLVGFVLNKFRGDAALLAPAPQRLHEMTGVPVLATLPMLRAHGLPEEDGVFDAAPCVPDAAGGAPLRVAIVGWPHISNLDEFQPLKSCVHLTWARDAAALAAADIIILPGSKAVAADVAWLRAQGMDAALAAHAARGARVLGICGGAQALGAVLDDPHGVEGGGVPHCVPGLELLALHTTLAPEKRVQPGRWRLREVRALWSALADVDVQGYEIRAGRTAPTDESAVHTLLPGLAWQNAAGNVLGLSMHGLFENAAALRALFGAQAPSLDAALDSLAAVVGEAFGDAALQRLIS